MIWVECMKALVGDELSELIESMAWKELPYFLAYNARVIYTKRI